MTSIKTKTVVTYQVKHGSYCVEFDKERDARDHALELMAAGVSAYLLRQTSEVVSLFDAEAKREEVITR